jgi:hypothetical protein
MHASRTRAKSWLSWIAIAGLWANAIYWSVAMIDCSRLPETYDGYRYRHGGAPADWVFPTHEVATWIGAMVVEALVVSVLLRFVTESIAGFCFTIGVLCGVVCFVMIPMGMHAPAPFPIHAVSLLFVAGWLIVMGIVSVLVILIARDRAAVPKL